MVSSAKEGRPLLLYDGTCNLCHGVVTFFRRRDRFGRLRFATQEGEKGRQLLWRLSADLPRDTVVLVHGEQIYCKSAAVLQAMKLLPRPWPWLASALRLLPGALRDRLYDLIARHRYRLFGRRDRCDLP